MLRRLRSLLEVGEAETQSGRALVEERYNALRQQIPAIYLLAIVNVCGLDFVINRGVILGLTVPTVLGCCALVRGLQWLWPNPDISPSQMLKRMKETVWLTLAICLVLSFLCLRLLATADVGTAMAIILFGGLTAIGVSCGLSALPNAARIPLVVLALPLVMAAVVTTDPHVVSAALSLAIVALLVLRILGVNNSHFTKVVRSRSEIAVERELAEYARHEAIVAATTDYLTSLPNRRAFVAALDAEIRRDDRDCSFAVAIIDLDRFKHINDTFGHGAGDGLLHTVATRLLTTAGASGIVARLGGDEFGLLFPSVDCASDAEEIVERILSKISQPAIIGGRQFSVSGACGIAMSRRGRHASPSLVLTDADLALYEAKERTAGRIAVFNRRMKEPQRRRTQLERALQVPEAKDKLYPLFQPIFGLNSYRIVAIEALARWRDDELGEVSPSEFIPVAEQSNLIANLSDHMMAMAFAEARKWPASVRLSFNLSAVQLCAAGLAESVTRALAESGLSSEQLQVEVTETALLADFDRARENLGILRSNGVKIVLDDFGAGYASIGYLRELQFDQIKLDGGLVTAAQDSADGERLLHAVIGLCQALGVSAVAEHVENEQQLRLLRKMGCEAAQGYWLSPPMTADACRQIVEAGSLSALDNLKKYAAKAA